MFDSKDFHRKFVGFNPMEKIAATTTLCGVCCTKHKNKPFFVAPSNEAAHVMHRKGNREHPLSVNWPQSLSH